MRKKTKKKNPKSRGYHLRLFGITVEQYETMLKQQNGHCAICNAVPKRRRLSVDHDHRTGFVRGLLCLNCNRALGYLRDKADRASAAAKYLKDATVAWAKLSIEEQNRWLPFAGRSKGKIRGKRVRKSGALPRLPQVEETDGTTNPLDEI